MSLWKLLTGRWGSGADETDDVRIDASTNSLQTVDYAHHEIHSGSSFTTISGASGGTGTKATITFKTPDTTKWLHLTIAALSNVAAQLRLGEGATVTAASGTDQAPFNRNRNSGTASTVIAEGSAGGAGNVTTDGTVTDFGTQLIPALQIGSGKTAGESREVSEWVLKQNTVYAFEVESQASSSEVTLAIDWYEHTDKH